MRGKIEEFVQISAEIKQICKVYEQHFCHSEAKHKLYSKGRLNKYNCTANKEIQDGRANADILGAGSHCIHYAWIHA